MTTKTTPEIFGTLPVDTGDAPGEPSGVKGIKDGEAVDAARTNRPLVEISKQIDLLSYFGNFGQARWKVKAFSVLVPSNEVLLDARFFTGDFNTSSKDPKFLERIVRVTDFENRPLVINGTRVYVTDLKYGTGSDSWIDIQKTTGREVINVSGAGLGFELQTITLNSPPPGVAFDFVEPGDLLTISGGTPNDGLYLVGEVDTLTYKIRVRSLVQPETVFQQGTFTGDLLIRTNQYFGHRCLTTDPAAVRITLNTTLPAGTEGLIHYGEFCTRNEVPHPESFGFNLGNALAKQPFNFSLQSVFDGECEFAFSNLPIIQRSLFLDEAGLEVSLTGENGEPFGAGITKKLLKGFIATQTSKANTVGERSHLAQDVVGKIVFRERSNTGDAVSATGLYVSPTNPNQIVDPDVEATGNDLEFVSAHEVKTSEDLSGVETYATLSFDGNQYHVLETALVGSEWHATVLESLTSWTGGKQFSVYSRVWSRHPWGIVPNYTVGIAFVDPFIGNGLLSAGSDLLTCPTGGFSTKVRVGDIVYFESRTNNADVLRSATITAVNSDTEVQLSVAAIEEEALNFMVVSGKAKNGLGFVVKKMDPAHILEVEWFSAPSWSNGIDNVAVIFLEIAEVKNKGSLSGNLSSFLNTLTWYPPVQEGHVVLTEQGTPRGGLLFSDFSGISNPVLGTVGEGRLRSDIVTYAGSNLISINSSPNTAPSLDFFIDPVNSARNDTILILEGPDAGRFFQIKGRVSAGILYVEGLDPAHPTPSYNSPTDGLRALVVPSLRAVVLSGGQALFKEVSTAYREKIKALSIGRIQADDVTGDKQFFSHRVVAPSKYCWMWTNSSSTGTPLVRLSLDLYGGEVLRRAEILWQQGSYTAVANPYSSAVGTPKLIYFDPATLTETEISLADVVVDDTFVLHNNQRLVESSTIDLIAAGVKPHQFLTIRDGSGNAHYYEILGVPNNQLLWIDRVPSIDGSFQGKVSPARPLDINSSGVIQAATWILGFTTYPLPSPCTQVPYLHFQAPPGDYFGDGKIFYFTENV